MFILVPILMVGMITFMICMMFVPSFRSKFFGHQLKMQKRVM